MRVRVAGIVVAAVALAALVAIACADDPHRRTSAEQALGGGGACAADPGQLPIANCDNSDQTCTPQPGCVIDQAHCGSSSTCLPMADNTGKSILDFRIRRLNIATPPSLASDFIQNTVVTENIDLSDLSCGEVGKGLFTWLLRIDKNANTLTTGGAPPATDPFGQGFCFASFKLGPENVAPVTLGIAFDGTTFKSTESKNVNIPIFLSPDPGSAVLLPISHVVVSDVTLSPDDNCIGQLNTAALGPDCHDDPSLCSKWVTAGALGGYITLEEADTVLIRDLNYKSLCSLLAGDSSLLCARDASNKVAYKGDFCSTDQMPNSCGDSVWMAATFAAAAAKIFDGSGTVAACSGVIAGDAGTDAADAGDAD